MDEAYFPPGVPIISYKTPVFSSLENANGRASQMIRLIDPQALPELNVVEFQETINRNIESLGEVLFILECKYKDGSWLGLGTRTTVIAMSLDKQLNLNYLSSVRRKELDELFQ